MLLKFTDTGIVYRNPSYTNLQNEHQPMIESKIVDVRLDFETAQCEHILFDITLFNVTFVTGLHRESCLLVNYSEN